MGNNSAQVLMGSPVCITATSCPGNSKGHHPGFKKKKKIAKQFINIT